MWGQYSFLFWYWGEDVLKENVNNWGYVEQGNDHNNLIIDKLMIFEYPLIVCRYCIMPNT